MSTVEDCEEMMALCHMVQPADDEESEEFENSSSHQENYAGSGLMVMARPKIMEL